MFHPRHVIVVLACIVFIYQPVFAGTGEKITFGFLPYFSATKLIQLHTPLIRHLEAQTGLGFAMVSAPGFKAFRDRTRSGRYDLIYTAPHMARLAELESGYQRAFMSTHRGRPIFLAKQDAGIDTLKDLENRKISLPPPKAINHHVALTALKEQGLVKGNNLEVVVTPSHNSALLSLLSGQVAVAVMGNAPWNSYKKEYRDRVKVLATSADFPGFLVMAHERIPKDTVEKIRAAALKFAEAKAGKSYFKNTGLKGFAPVTDDTMTELDPYVKAIFGTK